MDKLTCQEVAHWATLITDGEADPTLQARVAAHADGCAECRERLRQSRSVRAALRESLHRHQPSDDFKARLRAQIAAQPSPTTSTTTATVIPLPSKTPPRWKWLAGTGWAAALAASLALFTLSPSFTDPLGGTALDGELVSAHVRSLMVNHLTDVQSSDHHTVKPWFNGHLDLSPPVVELADAGFPLIGGRLDYVQDHSAAVLVYGRRQHVLNLFIWPSEGMADHTADRHQKNGYAVLRWRKNGLSYAIVSDLNEAEIDDFLHLWTTRAP